MSGIGGELENSGSCPKSVTAQGAAREAGGRGKPMAQAVGISCKRSPSPRSGRKMQAASGDFSVVERAPFTAEHNRCCAFALPTDTERREPHSFARFAGFTTLTLCPPRLAPWAFIYRPLRGLTRIRARAHSGTQGAETARRGAVPLTRRFDRAF